MNIKENLSVFARKAGFKVKKCSPGILFMTGTVTFAGTIAMAIRQTLSCDEIIKEKKALQARIDEACKLDETYANNENNKLTRDKLIMYSRFGVDMAKHYLPVVFLGSASLACFFMSNHILRRRYVVAMSSLAALTEVFDTYRKRVIDEYGEEMDRHFRFGTEKMTANKEILTNSGKKKTVTEEVENVKSENVLPSDDARVFDASNQNWDKNIDFNKMYLSATEQMANNLLEKNGNVFLNEIYDMLGFKRSDRGSIVGWIKGQGDGYIDFGFRSEANKRFVNGEENIVLLDFNHQGVIYDKI